MELRPGSIRPSLFLFNDAGVPWIVEIVLPGERYGRADALINEDLEPLVEFYDARYDHSDAGDRREGGQFVSRYRLSTLQRPPHGRLDLQGDVDDWEIDGESLQVVYAWLENIAQNMPQSWPGSPPWKEALSSFYLPR